MQFPEKFSLNFVFEIFWNLSFTTDRIFIPDDLQVKDLQVINKKSKNQKQILIYLKQI